MIAHLVVSTIVLAIVLAAAHVLPLRARTRCTLLLLGIAQFFVPAVTPRMLGFDTPHGAAIIRILGGPLTAAAVTPAAHVNWLVIAWGSIAAVLVMRALFAYRAVAAMIRRATRLPPRDGITLLRSNEIDTPALAGLFRAVILLPGYVDELDARELDALILHERAHLLRRDNIIVAAETLAVALLWFHPLVWWTRRAIATAREEACDEMVVSLTGADVYLHALGKVCRAAIAPRAATLSCMASQQLTERIEYMKKLPSLRALPHRLVLLLSIVLVAAAAVASGVAADSASSSGRYTANVTMTRIDAKNVYFEVAIIDRETGHVLSTAKVNTQPGVPAEVRSGVGDRNHNILDYDTQITTDDGNKAHVVVKVFENDKVIDTSEYDVVAGVAGGVQGGIKATTVTKKTSTETTSDTTISINLKDADIHDVVNNFAKLSNRNADVADAVSGKVTLNLLNVEWTEALNQVVAQVGARATVDDTTIHVTK